MSQSIWAGIGQTFSALAVGSLVICIFHYLTDIFSEVREVKYALKNLDFRHSRLYDKVYDLEKKLAERKNKK